MTVTIQYPQLADKTLTTPAGYGQQVMTENVVAEREGQHLPPPNCPRSMRYFSVGRSTEKVICPICKETTKVDDQFEYNFLDSLNSWLCLFSCCMPILSLACCYLCCRACFHTPRKFCAKCGAYLGFQSRPI